MRRMADSDELARALQNDDGDTLVALARSRPGRVVRFLTGRLYSADADEKWRAVRALGALAREPGVLADARVLDLLQRFLWALNDESGAVPFGVPEAIGEILAARPEHRASILPILCGMLTEEETFQTGPVERGIYWALGRDRTGRARPLPARPGRRRRGRAQACRPRDARGRHRGARRADGAGSRRHAPNRIPEAVCRIPSPSPNSRAGHPGWRRCASLKYAQYARSSRLATRAPRSGTLETDLGFGTMNGRVHTTD